MADAAAAESLEATADVAEEDAEPVALDLILFVLELAAETDDVLDKLLLSEITAALALGEGFATVLELSTTNC